VWSFLGACLLAFMWLLFSFGIAKFVLLPLVRWLLLSAFSALAGASGYQKTIRQGLGFPVAALLSRQRKARRGDPDSKFDIFVVEVLLSIVVSSVVQGLGTTILTVFVVGVLAAIGLWWID